MKTISFILLLLANNLLAEECDNDFISNLKVISSDNASVTIGLDYCLRESDEKRFIYAVLSDGNEYLYSDDIAEPLLPGKSSLKINILRPILSYKKFTSDKITVIVNSPKEDIIMMRSIAHLREWPALNLLKEDKYLLDDLFDKAVHLMDLAGRKNLNKAKKIIDDILKIDPNYIDAYHAMARYLMKIQSTKKDGSFRKGVFMAEQVLLSGKELNSENANIRVLLGYVYTWQNRYEEALKEFEKAEKIGTQNTWLYMNWGQMYAFQDKVDLAIKKYEIAANTERQHFSYDRAIHFASNALYPLYLDKMLYKKARKLMEKSADKFPKKKCFKAKQYEVEALYLNQFEDVLESISTKTNLGCKKIYQKIRSISALRIWDQFIDSKPALANQYYIKAITENPDYIDLVSNVAQYQFANSILIKLKAKRGLELKNSDGQTALMYSVVRNQIDATKRLLDVGAKIDVTVSADQLTPLMISVINKNIDMVKLLLGNGANRKAKTSQGATVIDIAKYYGLTEIEKLLESKSKT